MLTRVLSKKPTSSDTFAVRFAELDFVGGPRIPESLGNTVGELRVKINTTAPCNSSNNPRGLTNGPRMQILICNNSNNSNNNNVQEYV